MVVDVVFTGIAILALVSLIAAALYFTFRDRM